MWKVGCTKDAFAVWAAKVLALGYSVGRVEEGPKDGGGGGGGGARRLLERRLVQIYTPGTAVEGLLGAGGRAGGRSGAPLRHRGASA